MQDCRQGEVVPLLQRSVNGKPGSQAAERLQILAAYRLIEDPVLRRSAIDFVEAMAATGP